MGWSDEEMVDEVVVLLGAKICLFRYAFELQKSGDVIGVKSRVD